MPWAVAVGLSLAVVAPHANRADHVAAPGDVERRLGPQHLALGRPQETDRQLGRQCHRFDPAGGAEHEIPERRIGEAELRRARHEGAGPELGIGDLPPGNGEIGADRVAGVVRTGEELLDHLVDGSGRRQRSACSIVAEAEGMPRRYWCRHPARASFAVSILRASPHRSASFAATAKRGIVAAMTDSEPPCPSIRSTEWSSSVPRSPAFGPQRRCASTTSPRSIVVVGDEVHRPYDRPPLSKKLLSGEWEPDRIHLRQPDAFDDLDVEWRLGNAATALDLTPARSRLADGSVLGFDGLVIATGPTLAASPARTRSITSTNCARSTTRSGCVPRSPRRAPGRGDRCRLHRTRGRGDRRRRSATTSSCSKGPPLR